MRGVCFEDCDPSITWYGTYQRHEHIIQCTSINYTLGYIAAREKLFTLHSWFFFRKYFPSYTLNTQGNHFRVFSILE